MSSITLDDRVDIDPEPGRGERRTELLQQGVVTSTRHDSVPAALHISAENDAGVVFVAMDEAQIDHDLIPQPERLQER